MRHGQDSRPPAPPRTGPVGKRTTGTRTAADGTAFPAATALPEGPARAGVVVLPDIRGPHPGYVTPAERFAEAGPAAVAIDTSRPSWRSSPTTRSAVGGRRSPTSRPTGQRFGASRTTRPTCWWSPPTRRTSSARCSCPSCRGCPAGGALRAQIEGVRVRSDRRGGGLGGALVGWAVAEAGRQGCALVQLTTDLARPEAHRIYERLGFVHSHAGYEVPL